MHQFIAFQDIWIYAGMALLIALSAFMQGLGGVGFSMFAAPIAAIFVPQMVPATLLTLGGLVSLLTAWRERQDIIWPGTKRALIGRLIGTVIAISAMTQLSPKLVNLLFAALILLAVALSLAGWRIMATNRNVTIAGIVSGLMGTLTSVGAPPLAIAFQHSPPPGLRATLGATLFVGSIFSLSLLALTGHYSQQQFFLGLALAPFMVLGFTLSSRVRRHVRPAAVRRLLLTVCSASAIGLIVKIL